MEGSVINARELHTTRITNQENRTAINLQKFQYAEAKRDLELARQELSKLKLDIASLWEEKTQSETEFKTLVSKTQLSMSSVERLRTEIDAAKEETVFIELAQIKALQDYQEINEQRDMKEIEFSFAIEEKKTRLKELVEESDKTKELETKLAATLSDINMLDNQLKLVKQMERRVQRSDSRSRSKRGSTSELEVLKYELFRVKEDGFKLMSSMDVVRNELRDAREETARLMKNKENIDSKVKSLSHKLLRAKAKLETVSAAEENAEYVKTELSLKLEKLKADAALQNKSRFLAEQETAILKAETRRIESEVESREENFRDAIKELEVVKSSEAIVLKKLGSIAERIQEVRASASKHSPMIKISKYEYEYLTGHALVANETADMKIDAARTWIEALRANEEETMLKIKRAEREMRKIREEEEEQIVKNERLEAYEATLPRKSVKANNVRRTPIRAKPRISSSSAIRMTPTYFVVKKKRKVMPKLAKFFTGKK